MEAMVRRARRIRFRPWSRREGWISAFSPSRPCNEVQAGTALNTLDGTSFGLFISSSSLLTIPSLLQPFWLNGSESGGVVATLRTKSGYHQHYEVSPPLFVGATLTSHYSSTLPLGWRTTGLARTRGLELVRSHTWTGGTRTRHGDVPHEVQGLSLIHI